MNKKIKVIISGGGTGGHIFPAISIANAIKELQPEAEILFVGAENRMEMQRVPDAGYEIVGLPVAGFDRKNLFKNVSVLIKLFKSQQKAKKIIKEFKPDVAIGVGGYASGPTLNTAGKMGIPTLIQEQNSYAGVTNKLLAKRAKRICVAYDNMDRFFEADKILMTGNPIRQDLQNKQISKKEALKHFNLDPDKKTILILGGSLGARSINQCIMAHLDSIKNADVQFIWQTGKIYFEQALEAVKAYGEIPNLYINDFIKDMVSAYQAADLIISRAGAGSISEFCLLGKPVVLVPSPNVAEDHQTKNAMALVDKQAAIYIKDVEANEKLIQTALHTIADEQKLQELSNNIKKLALPNSASVIAKEIFKLAGMDIKDSMDVENINSVYFVGAGGIGMSALVRYFLSKGKKVAGYDRTETELTKELNKEGAEIHYEDSVSMIPAYCMDKQNTLVILTPAVPDTHSELQYFRNNGFEIQKRAQVLGTITRSGKALCVAGTHGKTTTSAMLAHLLYQSHVGCTAFLGGISKNYHTNLLLSHKSPYIVIEADEFDRSFHWLSPYMTAITSTDPDHLDIYGTAEAYVESFEKYTSLIKQGGCLLMREGINLQPNVKDGVKIYTYSREKGDYHAENIRIGGGEIVFDLVTPEMRIVDIKMGVPISINIENGVAAMALSLLNGATPEEVKQGMESFKGVDRRFDSKIKTDSLVFLSDYAHHPSEIKQSISSLRELYNDKKITVVFQPHLYSRTNDFYKEFADSLSLADEVILLDIYPARELPIAGVTSQLIYDHLQSGTIKSVINKEELLAVLKEKSLEVLITLGAGDIEDYVPAITQMLEER
ncbi:UDP-N-acetylmuramate--L-alanine ligase [Bacteroides sp. 214]|nr:UDP-N-acetylmuramate--L-alanine ligase [Bacteroides sp. 214]